MIRFLLLFFTCVVAYGQSVKCQWDVVPYTNVNGYKLLWGPTTGAYIGTNAVDGRLNNTATATNLTPGRNYLVVLAVADDGTESFLGDEAVWTNRFFAPKNFKVSAVLQASQNVLGPWTNIAILPLPMTNQMFVRTRILLEEVP